MNKYKIAAAVLAMLLSLSACNTDTPNEVIDNNPPVIEDPITEEPPVIEPPIEPEPPVVEPPVIEEPVYTPDDGILYIRQNLPRMDGSTSLIPLEAGLRAKIFDISVSEATSSVNHTTTYGSFERLLNGEIDMIFSTPLSEDQYTQAKDKGLDLELVPIAAEAFVFVVNAENSVDTLTQQQIKDIYSGKITNWKEVGGEDVEIIAFQRNETSGSQNYMKEFMGDTPLSTAPQETIPSSMGSLMESVAKYRNTRNALGYSVYAYAADMYGLGDTLKFIKVDGVEPSKETMASKEYPLMNYNYIVYDKNTTTEPVKTMIDWICSDEGQQAIADAGYIPADPEITREYLELTGTGPALPEDYQGPTSQYTAQFDNYIWATLTLPDDADVKKDSDFYFNFPLSDEPLKMMTGIGYKIEGLKDKAVERKINDRLTQMLREADEKASDYVKYMEAKNSNSEYVSHVPYTTLKRDDLPVTPERTDYGIFYYPEVQIKNGYMCILLLYAFSGYENYYDTDVAYFDLYTGEELSLSDLFYEGVDVDKELNSTLGNMELNEYYDGFFEQILLKDFTQLGANDAFTLTFDSIYFNHDNTLTEKGKKYDISFGDGIFVVNEPRDMEGLFEDNVTVNHSFIEKYHYVHEKQPDGISYFAPLLEKGLNKDRNTRINNIIRNYIKETVTEDLVKDLIAKDGQLTAEDNLKLRFAVTEFNNKAVTVNGIYYHGIYEYPLETLVIDLKTETVTDFTVFLKDGWEKAAEFSITWQKELLSAESVAAIENNEMPKNAVFKTLYVNRDYGTSQKGDRIAITMQIPEESFFIFEVSDEYVNWN